MLPAYYFTPVLCALIGWGTNFLAIKMLFRPHSEMKWLGFKMQGVLPRRQIAIADAIGEAVEKELVKKEDLILIFSRIGKDGISGVVDRIIDEKLKLYKLNNVYPIDKMHAKVVSWLKSVVKKEAIKVISPEGGFSDQMAGNIDIKGLVSERIRGFSTQELEKAAFILMNRELKFVEFMGAVIGFFVGIVQLAFYVF
jgi:uncharacterized membrane protein YheB (UPF0754 family)